MRAVVQRVHRAKVVIAGETVGDIAPGLAVLLRGVPVATRRFGAGMQVELVNDGPATSWRITVGLLDVL